jgi:hypothetical protein
MRRELHERFMPDCVWTDNKNKPPSITFLSTELSTARAPAIASQITGRLVFRARSLRKRRAMTLACGKQWRLNGHYLAINGI